MYRCHVCGWQLVEAPWGESGVDPTWDICECCGCEFGYQDALPAGVLKHRERWLASGAKWSEPQSRPPEWDLQQQLNCIPIELPVGISRRSV